MKGSDNMSKPKPTTGVYASKHPIWLDSPLPNKLSDDELFQIIMFYVFYSPCEDKSHRSKPLDLYGWKKKPWYEPSHLKEPLNRAIWGEEKPMFYFAKQKSDFEESISGHDLEENFYVHLMHQRIGLVISDNSKSMYMSLFAHIRNSLAHGRLAMYDVSNDDVMFVLEDGKPIKNGKFEVTARIVILKSSLLKIIELIKQGPPHENDYSEDILVAIKNGEDTKKAILEYLSIDEKIWDKTIYRLRSENKVFFENRVWHIAP